MQRSSTDSRYFFNRHGDVDGKHAFLGASKYHWINYDLAKMERIWENKFASERGMRIHRIAADLIRERIRLAPQELTLNMYVNDSIGFRMVPEQVLMYSDNCFGTPDAIAFNKGILRVHDLKTGVHQGSEHQCEIYCALFCLEYGINPYDIEMILRIYQSDQIFEYLPDPAWIKEIMDKIETFDKHIEKMKEVML
jgi:hypothetical protein